MEVRGAGTPTAAQKVEPLGSLHGEVVVAPIVKLVVSLDARTETWLVAMLSTLIDAGETIDGILFLSATITIITQTAKTCTSTDMLKWLSL